MIVLGIDPGYAIVGYGVVEYNNNHFRAIEYGAVTTEAHTPFNERIEKIYDGVSALIAKYSPAALAVEKLFFNTNQKTAIDVARRGEQSCLPPKRQESKFLNTLRFRLSRVLSATAERRKSRFRK